MEPGAGTQSLVEADSDPLIFNSRKRDLHKFQKPGEKQLEIGNQKLKLFSA